MRFIDAASLVMFVALLSPTASGAQPHPLPQKQLSRGGVRNVPPSPQPKTTHRLYGELTSVHGAALVLRTRRGTLQRIDATAALAAGTYSSPLFVGKIIVAGGYYDVAHVFHAQSVIRLTQLDSSTSLDR